MRGASTHHCMLFGMLTLLLLSVYFSVIEALIPTPRYNGGCALVNQRIYCYGGTVNRQPSTDHYVFDITSDFSINSKTIDAWTAATTTSSYPLEPNSLFCMTALNDNTGYLVYGGLGYASTMQFLRNTTVIYNTIAMSWQPLQPQSTNQSQIVPSREGACTLDSAGRLWVWGGISDNTTTPNITQTVYHDEIQLLDLNTRTWSIPAKSMNDTTLVSPRLAHTATLNQKTNNSIYYIGGLQRDGEHLTPAPLNEILEYQIQYNTWIKHQTPQNSTIPSPRRLHTATWVPNSDDLIFVFGGSVTDGSSAVADYSYLLNVTSFIWTPINLTNTAATGAGSRFGHSAVMYKNHSLFILFGTDQLGNLRNDFFVIDMSHWQTVPEFKVNDDYKPIPISNNTSGAPSSTAIVNNGASSSSSGRTSNTTAAATAKASMHFAFCLSMAMILLLV